MPTNLDATWRPLLEAISFAARAHRNQIRKDGQTPYAAHVFRVSLIVPWLFGIRDQTGRRFPCSPRPKLVATSQRCGAGPLTY